MTSTTEYKALHTQLDRINDIKNPIQRKHALASIWEQVKDESDNAWGVYLKGRVLMVLGKPPPFCLMYLNKAIQIDPTLYQAMTTIGLLLRLIKQEVEAVDFMCRAEETARDNGAEPAVVAELATDLGNLLQSLGNVEAAETSFRQATVDDATYWRAYTGFASVQEKQGKIDEAIATLQEGMDRMPKLVTIREGGYTKDQLQCLFAAAVLHARREEWKEALKIFDKAYMANPDEWNLLCKVIQCHQALGNQEERNEHIRTLYRMATSGKVPTNKYCREQISTEHGTVLTFELFQLAYEKGLPVLYMQWEKVQENPQLPQMVSFGSHENLNEQRRLTGLLPDGHRVYHIDAHGARGEHGVIEYIMSDKKPTYDQVRQTMLDAIVGKAQPLKETPPEAN